MNRVGLLIIATNKYEIFIEPLLRSVEKYFFANEPIDIYLFVDKTYNVKHDDRLSIVQIPIEHKPFPYASLYRYKYFDTFKSFLTSEYLYYLDVDMKIVGSIGDEILEDIVSVKHPGFYKGGWGSNGCDPKSKAWLPINLCHDYKAGGFQGGKRDVYLEACNLLNNRINDDESKGIMAIWHDETHWNWYLKRIATNLIELPPSYCYPESWKIPFPKKILALDKDHAKMRS